MEGAGFKLNVGKGAKQKLINPAINYLVSLNRTCIADNFNKLTLNLDLLTFACVHTFSPQMQNVGVVGGGSLITATT